MKRWTLFAAIAALALPLVATAASPQKAGRWETTVEMEMPGLPTKVPPMTNAICVSKEDAEHPENALPKASAGCKVTDYKIDGNTVTWSMQCNNQHGAITGKGKIVYSGDTYAGTMDMTMGDQAMHAKYTGKYKGACDGTEVNAKK
jgi:hypothetical protein